ncbi:MAG: YdhR family protein [Promethearchaeota archaeon]|jgi:hypothetical protein
MEVYILLFKPGLPLEELIKVSNTRRELFKKVQGLVQKYYISDTESDRVGGVYIFDSKENLETFRNSELSKSTADAYQFQDDPEIKIFSVSSLLR